MLSYEQKRKHLNEVTNRIYERAKLADLFFAVCFWTSPVDGDISYRCAYFEDISESISWKDCIKEKYKTMNLKYYITSNFDYSDVDGGFFES